MGLAARPSAASCREAFRVLGDARPLSAEDEARAHHDREADLLAAICSASCSEWAKPDRGTSRPMSCIAALKRSRSSAVAIASGRAPMTSTP